MTLPDSFFAFIEKNAAEDPSKLRLKYLPDRGESGFDVAFAIDQIECRRKYRHKLSDFTRDQTFLFPHMLSGEQCSHPAVAQYNSRVMARDTDEVTPCAYRLIDLTAGLGIDLMTACGHHRCLAFEINKITAEVLKHNLAVRGCENVEVIEGDSLSYLRNDDSINADVIFVDPARREFDSDGKQIKDRRTYALADCTPDIPGNLDLILSRCNKLVIKASPMLDISHVIAEIPQTREVHIVAYKGECKELLVVANGEMDGVTTATDREESTLRRIIAVNITSGTDIPETFECTEADIGDSSDVDYMHPQISNYLYEPDSAVMKTGAWSALCRKFNLKKMARDTHIFLSEELTVGFPGRVSRIIDMPDGKGIKKLKGAEMRIVSRNHPLSAEMAAKKLKITKSSDTDTLYFITDMDGERISIHARTI